MAITTFGSYKKKLIRIAGDNIKVDSGPSGPVPVIPIRGVQLDADLLEDACHAALHAITGRQWKTARHDIAEAGEEFELPVNLIEIDSVYDMDLAIFIPKMIFDVGTSFLSSASEGNAWIDTPNGSIVFTNGVQDSGAQIYYSAGWELPVDDDEALECPEFCLTALLLYGASYVFLRKAALQSELAQFKTKVDSGTPEDIPAAAVGNYFLKRFESEMTRMPMKQKGTQ